MIPLPVRRLSAILGGISLVTLLGAGSATAAASVSAASLLAVSVPAGYTRSPTPDAWIATHCASYSEQRELGITVATCAGAAWDSDARSTAQIPVAVLLALQCNPAFRPNAVADIVSRSVIAPIEKTAGIRPEAAWFGPYLGIYLWAWAVPGPLGVLGASDPKVQLLLAGSGIGQRR